MLKSYDYPHILIEKFLIRETLTLSTCADNIIVSKTKNILKSDLEHLPIFKALCGDDPRVALVASMLRTGCTNSRPFQTVEPEKLTKKFYKNNFFALLGDDACI